MIGRTNKLYCSTKCKNYYHTNLTKVNTFATKRIDTILHRNRAILLEILRKHKIKIRIRQIMLDEKRFVYRYHTHIHKNNQGKTYHYVYDFAWMSFSDDEILIVRKSNDYTI